MYDRSVIKVCWLVLVVAFLGPPHWIWVSYLFGHLSLKVLSAGDEVPLCLCCLQVGGVKHVAEMSTQY